ncbi:MAG: hypothetical protein ABIP75_16195 [Pyrinomonadaceae bacterium]
MNEGDFEECFKAKKSHKIHQKQNVAKKRNSASRSNNLALNEQPRLALDEEDDRARSGDDEEGDRPSS